MKRSTIEPRRVTVIPSELDEGILYISDQYRTAVHLCCCGCGNRVITPLHEAGWRITENQGRATISPSIGNGAFLCNSHYRIRDNKVEWTWGMTSEATIKAIRRDRAEAASIARPSIWRRIWNAIFHRNYDA